MMKCSCCADFAGNVQTDFFRAADACELLKLPW